MQRQFVTTNPKCSCGRYREYSQRLGRFYNKCPTCALGNQQLMPQFATPNPRPQIVQPVHFAQQPAQFMQPQFMQPQFVPQPQFLNQQIGGQMLAPNHCLCASHMHQGAACRFPRNVSRNGQVYSKCESCFRHCK